MSPSQSQLSPRGAWVMGSLFVLAGLAPVLIGLGVFVPSKTDPHQAPPWVLVCVGLMFVAAGLAIVLAHAIAGGAGPDGDLRPGTPMAIRAANLALGLTVLGLMTSVFGWVGFGPGSRHFSTTISLPFLPTDEAFGRVIFGGGAVLMGVMWAVWAVGGVRRLCRTRAKN